jgi:cell division protein FtsN
MSGSDRFRDEDGDDEGGSDGAGRAGFDNDDTNDGGQEPYEAEQLDLDDEDERLPWLESGDEDDYDDSPDISRAVGMTLLGLVALAAIVGGIWWSTHRTPDSVQVADGGTIKAPARPYKEAPKHPGGKTFEGTGDTAFAVSEGQNRPAKLGEAGAPASSAARPSVDLTPRPPAPPSAMASAAAAAAARPTAAASVPAAASGVPGTLVQVGAYSTRASAEAAWGRMKDQYTALSGQRHQIVEGKADIGTVFRLQAMPGSADAAHTLCGRLKAAGLPCQVK